jgi:glycosyl hydrolase family 42 (putative beta-galactosidase)
VRKLGRVRIMGAALGGAVLVAAGLHVGTSMAGERPPAPSFVDPVGTASVSRSATASAAAPPSAGAGTGPAPSATSSRTAGARRKAAPAADAATSYAFGTLVTDVAHASEEAAGGVTVAMMELQWSSYEPAEGKFDAAYARGMRDRLAALRAAGMQVTLGLGMSFTPGWVYDYPRSRFVDQDGRTSGEANLVFNQTLRTKAERYLQRIDEDLGLENFWAVRLNSGGHGEVLYPGGGTFWAFDDNAQKGTDLPPTMAPNPMPGWRPGDRSVSTDAVRRWADWYVHGLVDVVAWQMRRITALGFAGYYQTVTPGAGMRPDAYARDVANYLPNGYTGVGAVWQQFYADLPDKRNVVAYISSMANLPGEDDVCAPGDASVPLTSDAVNSWSATRWIARLAREHGLRVSGENPGWNMPASLNGHYADTSDSGMMAATVRQMTTCGFQGMYWAHDHQLWTGPVSFDAYARWIAATNGSKRVVPPMP